MIAMKQSNIHNKSIPSSFVAVIVLNHEMTGIPPFRSLPDTKIPHQGDGNCSELIYNEESLKFVHVHSSSNLRM